MTPPFLTSGQPEQEAEEKSRILKRPFDEHEDVRLYVIVFLDHHGSG